MESRTLIMVRDIKDWHYDAYMIFPKRYIKKIKYGKTEKCREKILPPLKKKQFLNEINEISLDSVNDLLKSLYNLNQGICIENANVNEYSFTLGKIEKINNKNVILKEIGLCGKYNKEKVKTRYKDITCIFYKDEYSTKIIEYADAKAKLSCK